MLLAEPQPTWKWTRKAYWLYMNDPFDNRKRREAFETFGFEKGLEALAKGHA